MSEPLKTFSVGFRESAFDELPSARRVAQRFRTDHHEFVLEPDALDLLPRHVHHFDEPFADPAAIPTWHLARMTRQHVTVALNGDGGDEAFAGYRRYYADQIADAYRAIPRPLRTTITDRLLRLLPVQTDRPMERSPVSALRHLPRAADRSRAASALRWGEYFDEEDKWHMYTYDARQAVQATPSVRLLQETYQSATARTHLDRTLYTDVHNYLPGALLTKVDRATMAHSLEVRSPFLDQEVMELAARLPIAWKVKGTCTKRILRETFADLLPEVIASRGKMGFGVPLSTWFRGPLYEPARDLLLAPDARSPYLVERDQVNHLIEENRLGRADNGKRLWMLLNLEVWLRRLAPRLPKSGRS